MLIQVINNLLLSLLFIDMVQRRYPNEFQQFLIEFSFNCIYFYSKMQILAFKSNEKINLLINSNPTLLKIKTEINSFIESKQNFVKMYEFIKDGNIYNSIDSNIKYDFMIFSWLNPDKKYINKQIIYDINESAIPTELSEVKFLLVEIKVGENETYKLELKTDNYNYYLLGNKFTKEFFIFYLKHYLKIQFDNYDNINNKITLNLIDHNVYNFTIEFTDKNEYLVLEKSSYKVSNTNSNNDK